MSDKQFEPELGQMVFGQPFKQYEGSELLDAALRAISNELDRVMWNIEQKEYSSPFDNTGNQFECDTFKAHAYSWNDEEDQPWNFKWRDVEVSWYKWSGRGLSTNKPLAPDLISEMLDDCLAAVRRHEKEHKRY
jgi:hypothetical protein